MATTIKLKNGSGAPAASDLVQGEPAIDLTNRRLYTENGSGAVIEVGSNPSSLSINGTAVTATAAEINTLDGITSSTAELNILDGVTATAAELNILDGVTSTTAELNILDGVTSTATELNILDGVTSSTAELNILDGVTSTTAELNILDGVTSTAAELNILDGVTSTATELNILDGVTSSTAELNILDGVTSTAAELNILDGVTATATELNVLDGVTAFVDEDNMSSNSATSIPSQQSVKAYVDAQVVAGGGGISNVVEDTTPQLGGSLDVNGNAIVSTSNANIAITPNGSGKVVLDGNVSIESGLIDLKNAGAVSKIKFYCESSNAHAQTLEGAPHSLSASNTLVLPAAGSNLISDTATQTLTNKTLTSPDINTPDIDGGTIDGTVIGGSSAAAGTFSALVANSLTYPTSDGSSGQALVTNGSGTLSFGDVSGGGGITYVTKTANYTMSAGEGVIANTAGGAFTITLPASPSTGDQVIIADGNAWATTNLTVGRNSSTIEGVAADLVMDVSGISVTMVYDGSTWQLYPQTGTSPSLGIDDNATSTAVTIDGNGNVFVGTTDTTLYNNSGSGNGGIALSMPAAGAGRIDVARDGNNMTLNRLDSDGEMLEFYRSGNICGKIHARSNSYLNLQLGSQGTGITGTSVHAIVPSVSNARSDNTVDIGTSEFRWDDIYATNSSIQTSDAREKQDIEELTEAETRVAVAAKALLRKYRWKSAVRTKSHDARIHFGIIAQDLQAAFEAEGLDAGEYGMFIHSTWADEETGEECDRMGVRYSELLAFIIAAI